MEYGLSPQKLPVLTFCSFRYFEKHERHITRRYEYTDVLVMVFEGVLRFRENGVPIEVSAGEYYIQRYGLLQEGVLESDSPKYFYIHWKDAEYTTDENALPLRRKVDFVELFPLFRELETLRHMRATLWERSAVFYKILSVLHKNVKNGGNSEIVSKVISEVTADIRRPFSLEELAACCGYSKNQIINIFKRETGKTPYAYITDMKIDMAKQLLLNTESSLSSISIECGFGGYGNFYRTFVKTEGCSPAVWKKRQRDEIVQISQ
ncbi:MAG: helix-turn-helix transcriptional regulator [Clostridia bacterium]|nr:helix-turn-helix transcriptional regulator [Clostridia bacterium]